MGVPTNPWSCSREYRLEPMISKAIRLLMIWTINYLSITRLLFIWIDKTHIMFSHLTLFWPPILSFLIVSHWGRVTHTCASKLTIIGSDNDLLPGRWEATIWTIAGVLLIGPLGTHFREILNEIHTYSFKKMHLKMSSAKWRQFCLGLNVLTKIKWSGACFIELYEVISLSTAWKW